MSTISLKVTEYNHNEGSETIDVCFRITPPQGESREEVIPIYYDQFSDWCFDHGTLFHAFDVRHYSEINISYSLKEDCEIIVEGYLRHLFGLDETETYIKGLVHTPVLNRVEKRNIEFESLILEVQLIASIANEKWPEVKYTDPMELCYAKEEGAFEVLSGHLKNELNKIVEKYTPQNTLKVAK